MERQFLIAVLLNFSVGSLILHRVYIFLTSLLSVIHRQPLLWRYILLVYSKLMKKKDPNREEDIKGLLEVTVM